MVQAGTHSPLRDNSTLDRAGQVEGYVDFRENTTRLNLAQLAVIEKLNPGIDNLWTRGLTGRRFKHINKELGSELETLVQDAERGWCITVDEALRWNNKRREELSRFRDHRCRPVRCGYFDKGQCRHGLDCAYVHMEKEENITTRIFCGIDDDD